MTADVVPAPPAPPPTRAGRPAEDLRAPGLGAVAWLSALAGLRLPVVWLVGLLLVAGPVAACVWALGRQRSWALAATPAAWLLVGVGVAGVVVLRTNAVHAGPLPGLAAQRAEAQLTLRLTADPLLRSGRFSDYVLLRGSVGRVTARGATWDHQHSPVLLLAPTSWRRTSWGETVRAEARLQEADGDDLAAVVQVRGPPEVVDRGGPWLRVADRVRTGVRQSVAGRPAEPRALVPALVDGDVQTLSDRTQQDFRTSGLTHLLAVSGTNLTLVVGALLLMARGLGVRARGLTVVGAVGIAGFVLLARPEPSVLRAAAMGSVALVGMSSGGRSRASRGLGLGVLVLLLLDPWLAQQAGFALSALATAGIVYLAPSWRDALRRWLPRWVAEALAVPVAAQLVCTPLVAAISGQVSLVAVVANVAAAPVVGPATVLGLGGGVLSAGWAPLGRPLGWGASWCAAWLVSVAHRAAAVPGAALGWPADPVSLTVLTLLCAAMAAMLGSLLARRSWTVGVGALAMVALLVPVDLPSPGWPPAGWVLAACDVGQGDGLVLHAADGVGVVVDTGPDPTLMDACLRRLHVHRIPVVVLTHFHADHVDGLPGVLAHRQVGAIEVTTLDDPEGGVGEVRDAADRARVPVRTVEVGERAHVGDLRWQVLAPLGPPPADSDSPPNDASIVLLVQVRGVRLLLMGDEETGSQQQLAARVRGLRVDVLKVAHHGSAKQDPDFVRSLHPRLAVISDGVRNDYGHPAPSTVRLLEGTGAVVRRTDLDGDVVVTVGDGGRLGVVDRMPATPPRPGHGADNATNGSSGSATDR